jgi:hypothetical protein
VNSETLDSKPTPEFLMALGTINFLWASIEAYASAALFSLLEIDQHDFTILVGRSEVIPKFEKIRLILTHRSDGRLQQAIDLICKLQKLRPDRNAITHGYYQGKSARGEHIFFLMADAMIDEKEGGVRKMRVFTDQELGDHCSKTMDLFTEIQSVLIAQKCASCLAGHLWFQTTCVDKTRTIRPLAIICMAGASRVQSIAILLRWPRHA